MRTLALPLPILLFSTLLHGQTPDGAPAANPSPDALSVYQQRVRTVRAIPGLAAFWDFVQREDGPSGKGRFVAYTALTGAFRFPLQPWNISRAFWKDGEEATLADFPLLGRGPFGQAVQFRAPARQNDLPVLMVPRSTLHDSPLDVKGPGRSVSMAIWLAHQDGNHAIAGIWHEGTDTPPTGVPSSIRVRGQRQYGMFAGLGANPGSSSAHVSENGLASFGDKYAHHLAATREKMQSVKPGAPPSDLDSGWSVAGFVYNNEKKNVTAYLNGVATEYWIEQPASHPFFKYAAYAWKQARFARTPGQQPGEDPAFPPDQYYAPPESAHVSETIESETPSRRIVLRTYEYTKVRLSFQRHADGTFQEDADAELVSLKANPYWFGHDLYAPPSDQEGGPFTIGRVIHSNRHETLSAWIGGVAVYARALTPAEMADLAKVGRPGDEPTMLSISTLFPK